MELVGLARGAGQRFAGRGTDEDLLMVDLLRRAGRRQEAEDLARAALSRTRSPAIKAILQFQLMLLTEGDTDAYSLGLAMVAGKCPAVPEVPRPLWPSRREGPEAWPVEPPSPHAHEKLPVTVERQVHEMILDRSGLAHVRGRDA